MKKSIIILVLLVFLATGVFAQAFSVSAGAGGLLDWSFNNGAEAKIGKDVYYFGLRNMSFGGFLFFDATFVELNAGFTYGLLKLIVEDPSGSDSGDAGNLLQAGASILGKYPLNFGVVTFFPLLGASYNVVLVAKDENGNKYYDTITDTYKNFSQLGLLGGAGFDFVITGSIFLRVEALYQIRFATKFMSDLFDGDPDFYTTLGMGPIVKAGVGYKF